MAKKTNKTSHVLDLLTNGTSSEAGSPSRVATPKKVTVVDENSRSSRLSEELLNSLSEELGQEVPREEEIPAPAPEAVTTVSPKENIPEAPAVAETVPVKNAEPAVQPQADVLQTNSVEELRSKFGNRDEVNFHFLNVMEELLLQQDLEGILKNHSVCTCKRCQADVCALALTSLPSKYVVISKTSLSPVLNYYENKFKIAMLTELNKACAIVRETPHHSR